jgi:hypothetical protein
LLKVSKKRGAEPLLEVLKTFLSDLFVDSHGMSSANFIALVDLLCKEFSPARFVPIICVIHWMIVHIEFLSLPEEVVATFRQLHVQMSSLLMPVIISATETPLNSDNLERVTNLCSMWHSLLCLGKWLGSTTKPGSSP